MHLVRGIFRASNKFRTGNNVGLARTRARTHVRARASKQIKMASYEQHYIYKATILRFRDGDTVECFVECRHCESCHREVIRILNIESWEPVGREAFKASNIATQLTKLYAGQTGWLSTNKLRRDRYHRVLADIVIHDKLLSKELVDQGYSWYGVGKAQPSNQNSA